VCERVYDRLRGKHYPGGADTWNNFKDLWPVRRLAEWEHPARPIKPREEWTDYDVRDELAYQVSTTRWIHDGCADDLAILREADFSQLGPLGRSYWQKYQEETYDQYVWAVAELKQTVDQLNLMEEWIALHEARQRILDDEPDN
jgi:hypothetical protein